MDDRSIRESWKPICMFLKGGQEVTEDTSILFHTNSLVHHNYSTDVSAHDAHTYRMDQLQTGDGSLTLDRYIREGRRTVVFCGV